MAKVTPLIRDFVGLCLSQIGKPYIYGYEVNFNDPNPPAFDCSELVQWAGERCGVHVPDGSWNQLSYCYEVPLDQGYHTYGALLFQGVHGENHVVVSLGDGRTIEARGKDYGVNIFKVWNRPWTHAGVMPGFDYNHPAVIPVQAMEVKKIMLETDIVDEVEVPPYGGKAFYQLQANGGVKVVGGDGKPVDGIAFQDYFVVANDGTRWYFGQQRNQGEGYPFSYPGLPEGKRPGVRYFVKIGLG